MNLLEVTEIKKSFREDFWKKSHNALDNLSINIESNKTTGFIGHNGAGKTTLIKILMGFIKSDSGKVCFSDKLGHNENEIKTNIGYLPERPYFYPDLLAKDFIVLLASLSGVERSHAIELLNAWAIKLKIDYALNQKIKTFSKGMLQRLGFISAVIHDPKFIIMDEPLSGLDPIGRRDIKNAISDLKSQGKTIFFSSHIIHDLEEISDNVIIIDRGKLIKQGRISEILEGKSEVVEIVVGSYPEKILENTSEVEVTRIDSMYKLTLPKKMKINMIRGCLNSDLDIISVNHVRPTLEQLMLGLQN